MNAGDDWVEPSLRAPIPSFQEYNIERGGVLDQMAPLGTMPPLPKLKLRVKQYDPNVKKSRATKNGDGGSVSKEAKESATVQETSASRRRSESRKLEDRPASKQQQHVIREKEDDRDYTPKPQATKSARQGSSSVRLPVLGTPPNSKTQAGQEALRCVVEAAVSKSKELGNEKLGLAIQKLFEESLNNRTLADLLDAVLSQKPTPRQAADFQAYIKEARRQLKSSSSKPSSKSSSRKQSTSRTPHTASDRVERHTSSQHRSHQTNGRMPAANGNDDSQPPSKRLKRSGSVSSTSSLSSTQSLDLDPDLTVVTEGTPTPSLTARGRPALGPKLHTFSHKGPGAPAAGNKRERQAEVVSATNADQNPPDSPEEEEDDDEEETVELATRKRKLRKSFDNVAVGNSHQRQAPKPVPAPRAAPPSFPPQKLSTTTREDKEDGEDIRSPASSTFGEFLIPPPPGMLRTSRSRGATPSTLGRPKHTGRRGARVKMS